MKRGIKKGSDRGVDRMSSGREGMKWFIGARRRNRQDSDRSSAGLVRRPWEATRAAYGLKDLKSNPATRTLRIASRQGLASLLTLAMGVASATWAFAADYVYDVNGRLVVATNDAGESARYIYDPMGNLVEVVRLGADDLSIFSFSPARGAPGTQVRIQGHGFSADSGQNTLSFNGEPAFIAEATVSELITTVPAVATTGPLSITVGGTTATSVADFVVDESVRAPSIHSLAPLIGAVGDDIAVVGESMNPLVGQTIVWLGHQHTIPSTLTDNEIIFQVPANTGSGRVTIQTPFGEAISAQEVVALPEHVDLASVSQYKKVQLGGPSEKFAVDTADGVALALFEGERDGYFSAHFAGLTASEVDYSLYDVHNKRIATGTAKPGQPTLLMPQLKASGLYMLLMKPKQAPSDWDLVIERDATIEIDGGPRTASTEIMGQSKRLVFAAQAGQRLGLGASDQGIPTGSYVNVQIDGPDGNYLTRTNCYQRDNGCDLNVSINETGLYGVVLTTRSSTESSSLQMTLTLDAAGTFQRGEMRPLALARRGQNASLGFVGQAGETLALQIAEQLSQPTGERVYYSVYKPDGSLLTSSYGTQPTTMNLPDLPVSGEYRLFVDPRFGSTAQMNLLLAVGSTGQLQTGGEVGAVQTFVAGQHAYLSFAATAGQQLGLGISGLELSTGSRVAVRVHDPEGNQLAYIYSCAQSNDGCDANLSIDATGPHKIVVEATEAAQTMQFNATLSADMTEALQQGMPNQLNLARRGQNARFGFTGQAGETLALQVSGQETQPASERVYYSVYRPDGSLLTSAYGTSETTLNLPDLPETGAYSLFIDPRYGALAQMQFLLAVGATHQLQVDGVVETVQTLLPGQHAYLIFAATAGQQLGFGVSALELSTGSRVSIRVIDPDGDQLAYIYSCAQSNDGCDANISVDTTGPHKVVVEAIEATQAMQFNATLSTDTAGSLQRDVIEQLTLMRRGQNAQFGFTGQAGETLALQVSGQVTEPSGARVYYRVHRPDGSLLKSVYGSGPTTLNLSALPEAGEYMLLVDPHYGAMAEIQVALVAQ